MKNIKRLLMTTIVLLSASSMALMQPVVPVKEDAPFRITTGLKGGIFNKKDAGIALKNLGMGLGFAHNVGYDFQYGIAVSGDWAALGNNRLFAGDEKEKKEGGPRMDTEISFSFMPELAESLHFGTLLGIGWGMAFGERATELRKSQKIGFGDVNLRVGLGLSYGFTDMFAMTFAPAYTLTGIRFAASDANKEQKDYIRKISNLSGMELPVGFWISASDNVAVFLDINTKFSDFSQFAESWKEEFTLGVSFAI